MPNEAKREPGGVCEVCGGKLRPRNRTGVCQRTAECVTEYLERWRRANPKKLAATRERFQTKRKNANRQAAEDAEGE